MQPRQAQTLFHEENVTRNPYTPRLWLDYIKYLSTVSDFVPTLQFPVFERAVAALPGSYKIWHLYVKTFRSYAEKNHPNHPSREGALDVSSRAARTLRVSPVIWSFYVDQLAAERRFPRARGAINDALRALPITQHVNIWNVVTETFLPVAHPRTSVLLLRRYAKLNPSAGKERLWRYMRRAKMWDEAIEHLATCLSDPEWKPESSTREQLWLQLASVASTHGAGVTSADVPRLLRAAVDEDTPHKAEIWVSRAEYYIRRGLFEHARDVYEEAVCTVTAVRDFAVLFDAYAKFEESLVTAAMDDLEQLKEEGDATATSEAEDMLDLLMDRLEYLTNRRPMLLSDVWLRQNPHNVHEWHKRARMFKQAKDAPNVVDTYTKAVQIVDPWRATNGRPHTLWLAFAAYYEQADDLKSARRVLEKAVQDPEHFRSAHDFAAVWCEYSEMELRCNTIEAARNVLLRAVEKPERVRNKEAERLQGMSKSNMHAVVGAGAGNNVISREYDNSSPAWDAYKSRRIWHMLIDLSQSICPAEDVIELHNRMLRLKIATSPGILNGGAYLESKRLFEQAFRLYDKAVSTLPWPDVLNVWVVYLTKFVKRFGARSLERARDLFEEAIRSAPSTKKAGIVYPHPNLRLLYIMYADMEEKYSLARHAFKVLARAAKAVQEEDRPSMYRMYIVKLASVLGVTKTRPIYEEAITSLTELAEVLSFAVRYAAMETRLGEIDRARGIYRQTCQVAHTRARGIHEVFWQAWNDFELAHGSEDTFRDMLREKRQAHLQERTVYTDQSMLLGEGNGIENMVKDTESGEGNEQDGEEVVDNNETEETSPDAPQDKVNEPNLASNGTKPIGGEDAADLMPPSSETSDVTAVEASGSDKLKIVQKDLPAGVRNLVAAAHAARSLKRKHDYKEGEDEIEKNVDEDVSKRPIGTVERSKRRR